MFTGIITDVGHILAVESRADRRIIVACSWPAADIAVGASIACSGVCLTVVDRGDRESDAETSERVGWFAVEVSRETLGLTTAGAWDAGRILNLERALRIGDELGGHMVSGHVDGMAEVIAVEREAGSRRVTFRAPHTLMGFIASKGSVVLDGISLTVNDVEGDAFGVNCIPHTWAVTAWRDLEVGDRVNLEVDVLARYVARWSAFALEQE